MEQSRKGGTGLFVFDDVVNTMKGFAKSLMCSLHTRVLKLGVCRAPSKVLPPFGYFLPFISSALLPKVLMKFAPFHSGSTVSVFGVYFVAAAPWRALAENTKG